MVDPLDRPSAVVELDAVVPLEFNGRRVDWVATQMFGQREVDGGPVVSRSELTRWAREGLLTLRTGGEAQDDGGGGTANPPSRRAAAEV